MADPRLSMGLVAGVLLAAAPALADDCQYLTEHFQLCLGDSFWSDGTWENGGDSATLYAGDFSFEGFEAYLGKAPGHSLNQDLSELTGGMDEGDQTQVLLEDSLQTQDLRLARHIASITPHDGSARVVARMIASAEGQRIAILMTAPADTPLAEMDRLTRDMAGSIHPGAAP